MKRFSLRFWIIFIGAIAPMVFLSAAPKVLKSDLSVPVTKGIIAKNGILAEVGGRIFLEITKGMYVVNATDRSSFEGELIPPVVLPLPAKSPRFRMKEIISFEFVPDTGSPLLFADRYDVISTRERLKEAYTENANPQRTTLVKLMIPIQDDQIKAPELWKFLSEEDGWARIGGKTEDTSTPGTRLFNGIITESGTYSLFDADPPPSFVLPTEPGAVQAAPESPYPSVVSTPTINENGTAIPSSLEGVVSVGNPTEPGNIIQEPLFNPSAPVSEAEIPAVILESTPETTANASEIPAVPQIPAVSPAGTTPLNPTASPTTTEKNTKSSAPESASVLPALEASTISGQQLPKSGPDAEESSSSGFPFIFIFALGIIGVSMFFAFQKRPQF